MTRTERRRHPRAPAALPVRLIVGDRSVEIRVQNLSCSGIRFHAPRPLPLMSRVQIALELPAGHETSENPEKSWNSGADPLPISGVVVRCDIADPDEGADYDTAIFFDDLSDQARDRLSSFVDQLLG